MKLELTAFSGVDPIERVSAALAENGTEGASTILGQDGVEKGNRLLPDQSPITLHLGGSKWETSCVLEQFDHHNGLTAGTAVFKVVSGMVENANVAITLEIPGWTTDNYVMMPAAAYNGNRFRVIKTGYPPFMHAQDGAGPEMPVTITDVPHLSLGEGVSKIHLRAGDMATPCICVQFPLQGEGLILLGDHQTPFGYTGWMMEESADRSSATIRLEAPAVRNQMYQMCDSTFPSDDKAADFKAGDSLELRFRLYRFPCADIPALFAKYCEIREDLSGKPVLRHDVPLSHAFRTIEDKFIERHWNEQFGYLMTSPDGQGTKYGDWQSGWVGSGMHTLAFLADGSQVSRERSLQTWDAVFGILQRENGWIHPIFSDGKPYGDDFCHRSDPRVMLIRKDADLLLFAGRHIALLQKRGEAVPVAWMRGYRKLADAFVRLWKKNGQFGQFIDMDKDEILQGGTVSGGIAPGGLALAWQLTGEETYLETAIAAARHYHEAFVLQGLMNGGPGEILQNPDSESAFGLLESLVELYEVTGKPEWLPMAEDCAHQCASWCVSYDFSFPPDSVFGRLDMKTAGSVYANTQNKHSAPGICTLSGASLLKLSRATGNRFWVELLQAITHNITQYLSRPDRLIPTWEAGGGTEPPDGAMQSNVLPAGCMCERVNMCDWETKANVGGIFNGSCWCETSALLAYSEVPGIWLLTDTGEVRVFDHVDVTVMEDGNEWLLDIFNPTAYDAEIKMLIEKRSGLGKTLGESWLEGCPTVAVKAGKQEQVRVRKGS